MDISVSFTQSESQVLYHSQHIQADLHNLRNPRDYLGGTSWKSVILEAHLRKLEMKDCEYDAFFNKIDIEMIEYAFWSEQMH